mmetsp:Transcript_42146/g.106337  ORF Transcript_42146/g.106337 Transcript_42146/m.106337 type:complete len:220 (-) Transcript_42146:1462-2121(-)
MEFSFHSIALVGQDSQTTHCKHSSSRETSYIQKTSGQQCANTESTHFDQTRHVQTLFHLRRESACFVIAIIGVDHFRNSLSDGLEQLLAVVLKLAIAAAHQFLRTNSGSVVHVVVDVAPLSAVAFDHPVDESAHLTINVSRRVRHHSVLEFGSNAIATHQIHKVAQANGLVQKLVTTVLEVQQHLFDAGHLELIVSCHLFSVPNELIIYVFHSVHVAPK